MKRYLLAKPAETQQLSNQLERRVNVSGISVKRFRTMIAAVFLGAFFCMLPAQDSFAQSGGSIHVSIEVVGANINPSNVSATLSAGRISLRRAARWLPGDSFRMHLEFNNLRARTYILQPSFAGINPVGAWSPASRSVRVVAGQTQTVNFRFDARQPVTRNSSITAIIEVFGANVNPRDVGVTLASEQTAQLSPATFIPGDSFRMQVRFNNLSARTYTVSPSFADSVLRTQGVWSPATQTVHLGSNENRTVTFRCQVHNDFSFPDGFNNRRTLMAYLGDLTCHQLTTGTLGIRAGDDNVNLAYATLVRYTDGSYRTWGDFILYDKDFNTGRNRSISVVRGKPLFAMTYDPDAPGDTSVDAKVDNRRIESIRMAIVYYDMDRPFFLARGGNAITAALRRTDWNRERLAASGVTAFGRALDRIVHTWGADDRIGLNEFVFRPLEHTRPATNIRSAREFESILTPAAGDGWTFENKGEGGRYTGQIWLVAGPRSAFVSTWRELAGAHP